MKLHLTASEDERGLFKGRMSALVIVIRVLSKNFVNVIHQLTCYVQLSTKLCRVIRKRLTFASLIFQKKTVISPLKTTFIYF